ncbi:hypothetical protein C6501_18635 [Candidatus Poribacteria bacterium]|nr:MAG: hypothetical protein C6501_18635 [Candidatus Poribacteria bacterium]
MMKSVHRRISFIVVQFLIGIFLCSALLVGCDTGNTLILSESDEIFGKNVYFNDEKCSYTSDDENVYITCGPLAQIESDTEPLVYNAFIEDIETVYDGDTIQDVLVLLHKFNRPQTENLSLWPGVQRYTDGIYSLTDIRIRGIDAPELTWSQIPASLPQEKRQRIYNRGVAARDFLRNLIEKSSVEGALQAIEIRNPDFGTWAGRIVADVFCYHEGKKINVAEALIEAHHAVAYDGGTKTFDWGAEVLDFDDVVEEKE